MAPHPRITASATASPPDQYPQEVLKEGLCTHVFGPDWATRPDVADQVRMVERVFAASGVVSRHMAAQMFAYYDQPRSTGQRMQDYEAFAYPLAREALEACLAQGHQTAGSVTDLIVVSCTGHAAPGLDVHLARDLSMRRDVRRLVVGHMGCYGALVALRSSLALLRAHEGAVVAILAIELSSLHVQTNLDQGSLTGSALFGDAAASLLLTCGEGARGPELVDVYCAADFAKSDQMTWKITDEGFVMGLSRRIPITVGRNVADLVDHLLSSHGLQPCDITHWIVHPGGPDILEVVGRRLALSEEQLALSRQVLRDNGNCSSPTVLLILDRLLRSGCTRPGEWGIMMAFGPGLTLETCLLRF